MGFCVSSLFCCALLCVFSSFAVILMGKSKLIALLCWSFWFIVVVIFLLLFFTVPWVRLQCVIVVFFDFLLTVKAAPHECVIRTSQP